MSVHVVFRQYGCRSRQRKVSIPLGTTAYGVRDVLVALGYRDVGSFTSDRDVALRPGEFATIRNSD